MKSIINKNQFIALFIALFAVTAFNACSDISGTDYNHEISNESFTQDFDKRESRNKNKDDDQIIRGPALDDNGKIYVCKYVRKPGQGIHKNGTFEILKRGNTGLVHVDPNSIRNELQDANFEGFPFIVPGMKWQDRHFYSTVIDYKIGEQVIVYKKVEQIPGYDSFFEGNTTNSDGSPTLYAQYISSCLGEGGFSGDGGFSGQN